MTFTEQKERSIIEAMARAACLADGHHETDLDNRFIGFSPTDQVEVDWAHLWMSYEGEARRHYAMQKALMSADHTEERERHRRLLEGRG